MNQGDGSEVVPAEIPEATVARLPVYLRSLNTLHAEGRDMVSSVELAEMSGVNAAKVRKDLAHFGSYGTRGVGYDVQLLAIEVSRTLGLNRDWRVMIAGVGNLGRALANYVGFGERGFVVAALVDADPDKVGTTVGGLVVEHQDSIAELARGLDIAIGVIATPPTAAQGVADNMVRGGVHSILNFAPGVLTVPDDVHVRKVDVASELQILSFYQERRVTAS